MNDRFQTDFLVPQSTFLLGMGSVLEISGWRPRYNTSENPDEIALSVDWHIVGQEIRDAMKIASEKSGVPTRR